MPTTRERVQELHRGIEDADCEHGAFVCSDCANLMIERAINSAIDDHLLVLERKLSAFGYQEHALEVERYRREIGGGGGQ